MYDFFPLTKIALRYYLASWLTLREDTWTKLTVVVYLLLRYFVRNNKYSYCKKYNSTIWNTRSNLSFRLINELSKKLFKIFYKFFVFFISIHCIIRRLFRLNIRFGHHISTFSESSFLAKLNLSKKVKNNTSVSR